MKTKNCLSILAFISCMVLAGCGSDKGSKNSSQTNWWDLPVDPVSGNFTMTTDLEEPQEIHTELQKEFLSYSGEYLTMSTNDYPKGNQLLSDPLPAKLEWEYAGDAEVDYYSVTFGQNPDLSDGFEVKGTAEAEIELQNVFLGNNFFKVAAHSGDDVDESGILRFKVDGTSPRNLAIGGMTNCRDLGGRITEDGAKVKQGLVYRTSGYHYDYTTAITDAGKEEMINHLGVKTEINVSDNDSYNVKLDGVNLVNCYMDYNVDHASNHHLSRNVESVKNFMLMLADSDNYPIFYHCRIGTDRTGLCTILTYGLLGVELNQIFQDYLFSNFGNIQNQRKIGAGDEDDITNYINELKAFPGKTFKNKVYNFLLSVGLSRETLNTIISNLTEGDAPSGNETNQQVVLADSFIDNGCDIENEVKTEVKAGTPNRNNPEYYAVVEKDEGFTADVNVEEAGDYVLVSYFGIPEYTTSKKLADAIEIEIDSEFVELPDLTYVQASMGYCNNSGKKRTNYYSMPLGEISLDAGVHTISFKGSMGTTYVGSICLFAK